MRFLTRSAPGQIAPCCALNCRLASGRLKVRSRRAGARPGARGVRTDSQYGPGLQSLNPKMKPELWRKLPGKLAQPAESGIYWLRPFYFFLPADNLQGSFSALASQNCSPVSANCLRSDARFLGFKGKNARFALDPGCIEPAFAGCFSSRTTGYLC